MATLLLTSDLDRHLGSIVGSRRNILHLSQRQQPIHDLSKDDVLAIQKGTRLSRDEKLASVGPRS